MFDFHNKVSDLTFTLLSSEKKQSGSRWSPKIPEPTPGRKFHAWIRRDTDSKTQALLGALKQRRFPDVHTAAHSWNAGT